MARRSMPTLVIAAALDFGGEETSAIVALIDVIVLPLNRTMRSSLII